MRGRDSFLKCGGIRCAIFAVLLLAASVSQAVRKGLVMNDEAAVFEQPDFDSTVIMTLQPGRVFDISDNKRGPFYKIRYQANKIGWISDADVQPITEARARELADKNKKPAPRKADDGSTMSVERDPNEPKERPTAGGKKKKSGDEAGEFGAGMEQFGDEQTDEDEEYGAKAKFLHRRRYRGLVVEMVSLRENTMGKTQQATMPFYGARFSGPDTIIGGDTYVDSEIVYHPGAAQYYANGTGNVASGYLMLASMLLQADLPQSRNLMFFGGIGPMLRYSHVAVTLNNDPNAGQQRSYNLDDVNIGAVVNAGTAVGFGRFAVRLDARYYWETQTYMSFGLALQMDY